MPFLRVEQGSCPGQLLEVAGERVVIGRHPGCEIVLDNAAVSRQHAQISESHGSYFLEDLRSRNRTFLNGRPIEGTAELQDGDAIEFCDLSFRFYVNQPPAEGIRPSIGSTADRQNAMRTPALPFDATVAANDEDDKGKATAPLIESGSSILSTVPLNEASSLLLAVKPEQKLRAVLDIGRSLGHALELGDVLEKTLDGLFRVFPQADHGFVLLKEGEKSKLTVRAAKSRKASEAAPEVSMTVVRRAMKTGEAILSADVTGDSRFAGSDSIATMSLRSVMCVPLFSQGEEPFGVVQLDCDDASRPFTKDDLDVLASVAGQIGLAVENARLHTELVAQRDIQRELDFAMQVQLGFLPSHPPDVPGYEFFDHYEAAQRVGGDYFDYVELADGRIAVTVGDVAGKGVPAALLMARLFSSARYQLLTRPTPGEALGSLNSEIARTALG
ncbi:MAG: FHA domain-containing protein, partial [Planctomycetota bacterium]|nr:FHA domain-containing protein [Planctomycetota bacterium]